MFHICTRFFSRSRARKGLITLMEAWEAFPPSSYLRSDGLTSHTGLSSSVFSPTARNADRGIYGQNTPQFVLDHLGWDRILRETIKREKKNSTLCPRGLFSNQCFTKEEWPNNPRKLWINMKGHRIELSDSITQRFTSFVFPKESVTDPSILITFATQLNEVRRGVFLPEKPHGQQSLAGNSPWGHRVRHDWATDHNGQHQPQVSAGRMLNLIKPTGSKRNQRNQSRNQSYNSTVVLVSLYKGAGEAAAFPVNLSFLYQIPWEKSHVDICWPGYKLSSHLNIRIFVREKSHILF